jgi:hypothetical protein
MAGPDRRPATVRRAQIIVAAGRCGRRQQHEEEAGARETRGEKQRSSRTE